MRAPPGRFASIYVAWLRRVLAGDKGAGLRWENRFLFFALLGLGMGTFFDAFHVFTSTAGYVHVPRIPLLDVAWYVPFEFTVAGVVVGMVRPVLDQRFDGPKSRLTCWKAVAGMVFFSLAWGGSGLLTPFCWLAADVVNPVCTADPNVPYLILLLVIGGAAWYAFDRTVEGVLVALFTAGIGVGVELFLIHVHGSYRYSHGDFHGVPSWLPALYIIAAGSIGNFGRFLKQDTGPPACLSGARAAGSAR